jgi:hypothetical protein
MESEIFSIVYGDRTAGGTGRRRLARSNILLCPVRLPGCSALNVGVVTLAFASLSYWRLVSRIEWSKLGQFSCFSYISNSYPI